MRIFLAMKENAHFIRMYDACATSFRRIFLAMKENCTFHDGLRFGKLHASFPMMKTAIFLTLIVCCLFMPAFAQSKTKTAAPPPPANPYQEADNLFTFGDDAGRDKQSMGVIERALGANGNDYQWLWRAARVYYFVGDQAAKAEKVSYFEKGINVGQRAVAANANGVEGHFWLGVNYGGYSDQKGVFKALTTVGKIRAEMETVLGLNDRYQDGGAYLALGEMDRQLPRIIGGNMNRAIQRLEKGVSIAPHNLEIKLALGQAYEEKGRKEDARRMYQEIIQKQSPTKSESHVQEKAKRLIAKL
jgi:tetratricopeptide (TPR) repeat protein